MKSDKDLQEEGREIGRIIYRKIELFLRDTAFKHDSCMRYAKTQIIPHECRIN